MDSTCSHKKLFLLIILNSDLFSCYTITMEGGFVGLIDFSERTLSTDIREILCRASELLSGGRLTRIKNLYGVPLFHNLLLSEISECTHCENI